MSLVKISELSQASSAETGDLFYASKAADAAFQSKSIPFERLAEGVNARWDGGSSFRPSSMFFEPRMSISQLGKNVSITIPCGFALNYDTNRDSLFVDGAPLSSYPDFSSATSLGASTTYSRRLKLFPAGSTITTNYRIPSDMELYLQREYQPNDAIKTFELPLSTLIANQGSSVGSFPALTNFDGTINALSVFALDYRNGTYVSRKMETTDTEREIHGYKLLIMTKTCKSIVRATTKQDYITCTDGQQYKIRKKIRAFLWTTTRSKSMGSISKYGTKAPANEWTVQFTMIKLNETS